MLFTGSKYERCSNIIRWQDDPNYEEKFKQRTSNKIDPTKNCDAWTAYRDREGYGRIRYHEKMKFAHHVVWYLEHNYWPEYLLHTCDTPGCVNVEHLREGSHRDNVADRDAKGRQAYRKGERNGRAKLTDIQAKEVFDLRDNGLLQREIAEVYRISKSQVSNIQRGRRCV